LRGMGASPKRHLWGKLFSQFPEKFPVASVGCQLDRPNAKQLPACVFPLAKDDFL
jgi:hypothetical protein